MASDAVFDVVFQDNNDKQARTRLYLPSTELVASHLGRATALASAMQSISSANVVSGKLTYSLPVSPQPPAEITSNVYRRGVLVFRDGSNYGILSVPSWRELYTDLEGDYRAIRISRERLSLLGVLPSLESAVQFISLPWGDTFPANYSVGSITELTS